MRESTNKISDPKIAMHVAQKIAGHGIRAPSRVTVVSAGGQVTLSGTIQHSHQRQAILQALRGMPGVKGVVDSLKLMPQPTRK
jgi:osmotically-inducible protein OsmY